MVSEFLGSLKALRAVLIAWLAVLAALCMGSASAQEFFRLVPVNPPPPLVAPEMSKSTSQRGAILDLIAEGGPWFNETMVRNELKKTYDAQLQKGLEEAARLGMSGALVKVQVLSTPMSAGTEFFQLRGQGAVLVGVGMDASSVCFAATCFNTLQEPMPSGASLTQDSGYVWVAFDGSEYKVSRYSIGPMESRASQLYLNTEAAAAYKGVVEAEAVSAYAAHLRQQVTTVEDSEAVTRLIKNRDVAIQRINALETELAKQLRRAERAAKTSAGLNALAGVLNLASAIAVANQSMGEDIAATTPEAIDSKADLLKAVDSIQAQSGQRIKAINVTTGSLRNEVTGWTGDLISIGIKYNMNPPSGSVLKPR